MNWIQDVWKEILSVLCSWPQINTWTITQTKAEPESYTSGESGFESAEESLAPETTGQKESLSLWTKSVEEEPYLETKTTDDPSVSLSFWTEPRPPLNLYSPIENLFASLLDLNQPLLQQNPPNIMATTPTTNGSKELNLNKPDTFNKDQEKFRKLLQHVKHQEKPRLLILHHRSKNGLKRAQSCTIMHKYT
jgi:hypothetical protein